MIDQRSQEQQQQQQQAQQQQLQQKNREENKYKFNKLETNGLHERRHRGARGGQYFYIFIGKNTTRFFMLLSRLEFVFNCRPDVLLLLLPKWTYQKPTKKISKNEEENGGKMERKKEKKEAKGISM